MIAKLPWDKNEKDFIKFLDIVDESGHVLDIGANIGVMTYYFSKNLKSAKIYSFEPIPINYRILERIVRKFNLLNVKIYDIALGDKHGIVKMVMPENKKVYFHGLSHVDETIPEDTGAFFDVKMRMLDEIDQFKDIKVTAIKLDVEDYEYNVLKGSEQLIKKNRPFIYSELWESENRKKCFDFFSKLNYRVFINQNKTLKEYFNQVGFQNFFFIPTEHCDKLKLS